MFIEYLYSRIVAEKPLLYGTLKDADDALRMIFETEVIVLRDDKVLVGTLYQHWLVNHVVVSCLIDWGWIESVTSALSGELLGRVEMLRDQLHTGFFRKLMQLSVQYVKCLNEVATVDRKRRYRGLDHRMKGEVDLVNAMTVRLEKIARLNKLVD